MSRLDIFSFFYHLQNFTHLLAFSDIYSIPRCFSLQRLRSHFSIYQLRPKLLPTKTKATISLLSLSLSLSRIQFIHFLSLEFYSLIFNVSLSSPAPMLGLQRHHYPIPLKLQKWCSRDASSPPRNPTPPARTDPTPTPTPPDPSLPTPRSDRTRKSPNPPPRKTTSLLSAKHKQKMEPRRKIPKTNKL
jgi:hypothetical protein